MVDVRELPFAVDMVVHLCLQACDAEEFAGFAAYAVGGISKKYDGAVSRDTHVDVFGQQIDAGIGLADAAKEKVLVDGIYACEAAVGADEGAGDAGIPRGGGNPLPPGYGWRDGSV